MIGLEKHSKLGLAEGLNEEEEEEEVWFSQEEEEEEERLTIC